MLYENWEDSSDERTGECAYMEPASSGGWFDAECLDMMTAVCSRVNDGKCGYTVLGRLMVLAVTTNTADRHSNP